MRQIRWIRVIASVILISISAQITIDLPGVPITGQSLAILVCCALLKPWEALVATVAYVLLGAMGLPIFADGSAGWSKISGGTGGFILGFIVSGTYISWMYYRYARHNFKFALVAMTTATAVLLICGISYLSYLKGLEIGLQYGFYPIWKGAVVKILLGAAVVTLIHRVYKPYE